MESHGAAGARMVARWGDDGLRLLAHEGDVAARAFTRHGDAAVEAMLRHRGVAARIIDEFGDGGLRALGRVGRDGAVQMAGVAPALRASGRAREVMAVIERFGDRACAFVWRNKGVIFGAAVLAAFLADPEPYIEGVKQLIVEPAKELGAEAARRTDWTLVVVAASVLVAMVVALRMVLRPRRACA